MGQFIWLHEMEFAKNSLHALFFGKFRFTQPLTDTGPLYNQNMLDIILQISPIDIVIIGIGRQYHQGGP